MEPEELRLASEKEILADGAGISEADAPSLAAPRRLSAGPPRPHEPGRDRAGNRIHQARQDRLGGIAGVVQAVELEMIAVPLRQAGRVHRKGIVAGRDRRVRPAHRRGPRRVHIGGPRSAWILGAIVRERRSGAKQQGKYAAHAPTI